MNNASAEELAHFQTLVANARKIELRMFPEREAAKASADKRGIGERLLRTPKESKVPKTLEQRLSRLLERRDKNERGK